MIVISMLVVAISVYIGKTLARDTSKESRNFKIILDVLLILVLVVLAIGLGVFISESAYQAGLEAAQALV